MPKFTVIYTILNRSPAKEIEVSFSSDEATLDTVTKAILHAEFPHLHFRFGDTTGKTAEQALKNYAITEIKISHRLT